MLDISFVVVNMKIHVYGLPLQNHIIKITTTWTNTIFILLNYESNFKPINY